MAKLNAFRSYPYTAVAWDFTLVADSTGQNSRSYFMLRPVKLDVIQDDFGRILCIFSDSDDDLRPGVRLLALLDKGGNEIYPGGIWTLNTYEPELNTFGYRNGFRGRANLTHETSPL